MLVCIVALDTASGPELIELVQAIKKTNPKANIFFIEHVGRNIFSNGALFNICVQLAGFSPLYELCFFSFVGNRWTISQHVSVVDFKKSNGYNNHQADATALDVHHSEVCGYDEIFAETYLDTRYNQHCHHYAVKAVEDRILKLNFVH
jgi:hypothetical protein